MDPLFSKLLQNSWNGKLALADVHGRGRPRFILHVGPGKTGTSSLQDLLCGDPRLNAAFAKDGYAALFELSGAFRGPKAGANLVYYFLGERSELGRSNNPFYTAQTWRDFEANVAAAAAANVSVIMTSEGFDDPSLGDEALAPLAHALKRFDVTVVAAYRPFFDWFHSFYTEICRSGHPMDCVPFDQYLRDDALATPSSRARNRFTDAVRKRFQRHFPRVEVFNTLDRTEPSTTASFVCHHVPGALNACAAARNVSEVHANSGNPAYESALEISIAAVREGLLPPLEASSLQAMSADQAIAQLRPAIDRILALIGDGSQLPRTCLSPSWRHTLYDLSETLESQLVPKWSCRPGHADKLAIDFARAADTKLRGVDVQRLLPTMRSQLVRFDRATPLPAHAKGATNGSVGCPADTVEARWADGGLLPLSRDAAGQPVTHLVPHVERIESESSPLSLASADLSVGQSTPPLTFFLLVMSCGLNLILLTVCIGLVVRKQPLANGGSRSWWRYPYRNVSTVEAAVDSESERSWTERS